MTARFVDTNVLLYAVSTDAAEQRKSAVASELLSDRELVLSVQVLQEFYVQATRSSRTHRLEHSQAAALVEAFTRFRVVDNTAAILVRAIETRDRWGISFWDASVIEAARAAGCEELLSEDLADGQDYDGVVVRNPFS